MSKQCIFDIEADHLDPKEVKNIWCIVVMDVETEEIFKYGPKEIQEAKARLNSYDRVIGHNIILFDLPVLSRFWGWSPKSYIDTLVLSRLSNPDRQQPFGMSGQWRPHSIEAWGHRLGGPKKVEHEDWSQFSDDMMNRCVTDVKINLEVYKALWKEFKE